MRLVLLVLALALALAAPALAAPRIKVAVLALRATNVPEKTAKAVGEAFVSALGEDARLEVVSQADVASMLAFQQQKELLGCDDGASCLAEIGSALGVRLLVTGSLARLDDTYLLDVQLIDVKTATVLRRASEHIEGRGRLFDAAQEVARNLHVAGNAGERHFALRAGFGGQLGILGAGASYRVGEVAFGLGTGRYLLSGGVTFVPSPDSSPYLALHVAWSHAGLLGAVSAPGVGVGVSAGYDWHPFPWLSLEGGLGLAWSSATLRSDQPNPLFFDLAVGPLF